MKFECGPQTITTTFPCSHSSITTDGVHVCSSRVAHGRTLLGIPIGETVPRIRVPAYYRYHIELAPEWRVRRTDQLFTVVVPAVRPSLPVAVDFSRMEKDASGTWVLLPFTKSDAITELQRELTSKLAVKAVSPTYVQMQRDDARKTVADFVEEWLPTQVQWKSAARPKVQVLSSDELDSPLKSERN